MICCILPSTLLSVKHILQDVNCKAQNCTLKQPSKNVWRKFPRIAPHYVSDTLGLACQKQDAGGLQTLPKFHKMFF